MTLEKGVFARSLEQAIDVAITDEYEQNSLKSFNMEKSSRMFTGAYGSKQINR